MGIQDHTRCGACMKMSRYSAHLSHRRLDDLATGFNHQVCMLHRSNLDGPGAGLECIRRTRGVNGA